MLIGQTNKKKTYINKYHSNMPNTLCIILFSLPAFKWRNTVVLYRDEVTSKT